MTAGFLACAERCHCVREPVAGTPAGTESGIQGLRLGWRHKRGVVGDFMVVRSRMSSLREWEQGACGEGTVAWTRAWGGLSSHPDAF